MDIVYAADDNYADVMGTSITSLLDNNLTELELAVYILDDHISAENKKKLQQVFADYRRSVAFLPITDFSGKINIKIKAKRWSLSAFSRIFLAELLPSTVKKILYIDCDTLVLQSIADLWNQDLDGAVLGAVSDCVSDGHKANVGLRPSADYFNSGLLLIDLERWEKKQVQIRCQRFIKEMDGDIPYVDQGVLNNVLQKQVKILPLKYNVYSCLYDFSYSDLLKYRKPGKFYARREVEEAVSSPTLVHFTKSFLSLRPWVRGSTHPYAVAWNHYKSLTPWKDDPPLEDNRNIVEKSYQRIFNLLPLSFAVRLSGLLHAVILPKIRGMRKGETPSMITRKELRVKSMPPEKEAGAKKDVVSHYLVRPISDIMTLPCLSLHISATAVTKFSLLPILFALVVAVFADGTAWFCVVWSAIFLWNLLDGVDGNIARYTDTCSPYGGLWDAAVGYLAMFVNYFSMGIMSFKAESYARFLGGVIPDYGYIIMGSLAGVALVLPRLVMQKKLTLFGTESANDLKQRENFGLLKMLVFNFVSINGLGAVLFLIAIATDLLNICTLCYFVLNSLLAVASMFILLHD